MHKRKSKKLISLVLALLIVLSPLGEFAQALQGPDPGPQEAGPQAIKVQEALEMKEGLFALPKDRDQEEAPEDQAPDQEDLEEDESLEDQEDLIEEAPATIHKAKLFLEVIDEEGSPLAGASLVLKDSQGGLVREVKADTRGQATIKDLPPRDL